MSIHLHKLIFSIQNYTRKRVNCAKMIFATKQQIMKIIQFLLASLPSFLYGIQKKTLSDLLTIFLHNKFFLSQHNQQTRCSRGCSTNTFDDNCQTPDLSNSPVQLLIGKSGRLYIRMVVWSVVVALLTF